MRYELPTIHGVESAISLVKSQGTPVPHQKTGTTCVDSGSGGASSNGAYELDE